jgi:hypothetical protein
MKRGTYKKPTLADDCAAPIGNWCGDNLSPTADDEQEDDNECFNWVNNPIRKMFDNPRDSSHFSYLDCDDEDADHPTASQAQS